MARTPGADEFGNPVGKHGRPMAPWEPLRCGPCALELRSREKTSALISYNPGRSVDTRGGPSGNRVFRPSTTAGRCGRLSDSGLTYPPEPGAPVQPPQNPFDHKTNLLPGPYKAQSSFAEPGNATTALCGMGDRPAEVATCTVAARTRASAFPPFEVRPRPSAPNSVIDTGEPPIPGLSVVFPLII